MRLIGLLVSLAVLGYITVSYLGSSTTDDGVRTKPAEYTDQAKQSVDALNDVIKKQQEQLQNSK